MLSGMVKTKTSQIEELVLNWDQTCLNIVPVGKWTLEKAGSNRVEIVAQDDKRQITATFTNTLSGAFLPIQILYNGKTPRSHPQYTGFPANFDMCMALAKLLGESENCS